MQIGKKEDSVVVVVVVVVYMTGKMCVNKAKTVHGNVLDGFNAVSS